MRQPLTPQQIKKKIEEQDAESKKLLAAGPKPGSTAALAKALEGFKKLMDDAKAEAD